MFVDDLAKACIEILEINKSKYNKLVKSHLNVGTGIDITIKDLAKLISKTIDYKGKIKFNPEKPDGTPRKVLNVDLINKLGGNPQLLEVGLSKTYKWMLKNFKNLRI